LGLNPPPQSYLDTSNKKNTQKVLIPLLGCGEPEGEGVRGLIFNSGEPKLFSSTLFTLIPYLIPRKIIYVHLLSTDGYGYF
jgi:hypothetical protein